MSCPSTALCICVLAMSRVGCSPFIFSPSYVYLIVYNRITCIWFLVSGFWFLVCSVSMYLSNCSPPLRAHLLNGDFFVGSSLATSLVKMVTRYSSQMTEEQSCNVREIT